MLRMIPCYFADSKGASRYPRAQIAIIHRRFHFDSPYGTSYHHAITPPNGYLFTNFSLNNFSNFIYSMAPVLTHFGFRSIPSQTMQCHLPIFLSVRLSNMLYIWPAKRKKKLLKTTTQWLTVSHKYINCKRSRHF